MRSVSCVSWSARQGRGDTSLKVGSGVAQGLPKYLPSAWRRPHARSMTTPHRSGLARAGAALALLPALGVAGLLGTPAQAGAPVGNCPDLDSGRVVVPGNQDQLVVTAPAGRTILGYCLKSAGLRGTTGAPYQVALDSPATSVMSALAKARISAKEWIISLVLNC